MTKILFSSIIAALFLALCGCKAEKFLLQKYTRYVHSLKCPPEQKKCGEVVKGPSFLNCSNCETIQVQDSSRIILSADHAGPFTSPPVANHAAGYSQPKLNKPQKSNGIGKVAKGLGSFGKELAGRFDYSFDRLRSSVQHDNQMGQEKQAGIFGFLNTIFKIILFVVILAVICAIIILVIVLP